MDLSNIQVGDRVDTKELGRYCTVRKINKEAKCFAVNRYPYYPHYWYGFDGKFGAKTKKSIIYHSHENPLKKGIEQ